MHQYYLFYKPFQVLSQFSKEGDKQTLADFLKQIPTDVYPVGRLDYDSEGLLLLTNDKQLTHQLLEPKFAHKRTYWVQVEGSITQQAIADMQKGVLININGKQHKTKPATVEMLDEPEVPERTPPIRFRKNIPVSWVSITLTEGKNRQVRRMTAAVGFPTLRLIRHSIGHVTVDDLAPGQYKKVEEAIKQQLLTK